MDKNVFFVSNDETLYRKLRFTLGMIGFECRAVQNEEELKELEENEADVVFFDASSGFRPVADLALELRNKWKKIRDSVMFLFTFDRNFGPLSGRYAVFDGVCVLPFLRQNIYKLLKSHGILTNREIKIVPFLDALPKGAVEDFLTKIQTAKTTISPAYSNGYHYPLADTFFPGDSRDSISMMLNLYSKGVFDRKIYDRVHQCPYCSASLINFRETCPQCHSIDFAEVEMLHHFPCGYVGEYDEFRRTDSEDLVCPKCDKTLRHIGMDYEKPLTSRRCNDCRMHFSIPAVRCLCFSCGKEFSPGEAVLQTFYSYSVRERYALPEDSAPADRKQGDPFSVTKETFIIMLRQNFGISQELGYEVQLIAVDGASLRDSERRELLRMIHEFKRPVDVVYAAPQGTILVLLFYLSREAVEEKVEEFKRLRKENPVIGRRNLKFQIHRFSGGENPDAGKVLDRICAEMENSAPPEENPS